MTTISNVKGLVEQIKVDYKKDKKIDDLSQIDKLKDAIIEDKDISEAEVAEVKDLLQSVGYKHSALDPVSARVDRLFKAMKDNYTIPKVDTGTLNKIIELEKSYAVAKSTKPDIPVGVQFSDEKFDTAALTFLDKSKDLFEKELKFAAPNSNCWKLYQAMTLLSNLEDSSKISDPYAKRVLSMRKRELEDLASQLNSQPDVKAAFERIRQGSLDTAKISQNDLVKHSEFILSPQFMNKLPQDPKQRIESINKELRKLSLFDPQLAAQTEKTLINALKLQEGPKILQKEYQDASPEEQQQIESRLTKAIGVILGSGDYVKLTADSTGAKTGSVAKSIARQLCQSGETSIENLKTALNASALSADEKQKILGTLKTVDGFNNFKMALTISAGLVAITNTAIDVGSIIYKEGMSLDKGVSLAANSFNIASIAGEVLGKEVFSGVTGTISGGITAGWNVYEAVKELAVNEDSVGGGLKLLAAGGAAMTAYSAYVAAAGTASAVAGPIGLIGSGICIGAAIAYGALQESDETGDIRSKLRSLGISDKEDALDREIYEIRDKSFHAHDSNTEEIARLMQWAKPKSIEDRARIITRLMDHRITNGTEEKFIAQLIVESMGKNKALVSDNFSKLISRIDTRKLSQELENRSDELGVKAETLKIMDELFKMKDPSKFEDFVMGLADEHKLDLIEEFGKSQPRFISNMSPLALKEICSSFMKGDTNSEEEIFITNTLLNLPPEKLALTMANGGAKFGADLVDELTTDQLKQIMNQFKSVDAVIEKWNQNVTKLPEKDAERLKVRIANASGMISGFTEAIANSSNSTFYNYEGILKESLNPQIVKYFEPETLKTMCEKLMDTTLWTPAESKMAIAKLLEYSTPAQLHTLLDIGTDIFTRKLGDTLTNITDDQLINIMGKLLTNPETGKKIPPDAKFQEFALGFIENGSKKETILNYITPLKHRIPPVDFSNARVLDLLTMDKTQEAQVIENMTRNVKDISELPNREKAVIIKYLMDGVTLAGSETLIKNIITDAAKNINVPQNMARFKDLISRIDTYTLANELENNGEALEVMNLIAKTGDKKAFQSYALRISEDKRSDVLFQFTSAAQNKESIKNLPANVARTMCEQLLKGYTGSDSEKAVTNLILDSSDSTFIEMIKNTKFSKWLSNELDTNQAKWKGELTGRADQLQSIMDRLGKLASSLPKVNDKDNKNEVARKEAQINDYKEAVTSFALAISEEDYNQILYKFATNPQTRGAVAFIDPGALKTMCDNLMKGYTREMGEKAITELLEKTSADQLRHVMNEGGEQFAKDLVSELQDSQLADILSKMIIDKSVDLGRGFSDFCSALAAADKGEILLSLIGNLPRVVQEMRPTVLQKICTQLATGHYLWMSGSTQDAIGAILKHTSPKQLDLVMQSNVNGNTKSFSDLVVKYMEPDQLNEIMKTFASGDCKGPGFEAFAESLAQQKGSVFSLFANSSPEIFSKIDSNVVKMMCQKCISAYKDSTLGYADAQNAVYNMLTKTGAVNFDKIMGDINFTRSMMDTLPSDKAAIIVRSMLDKTCSFRTQANSGYAVRYLEINKGLPAAAEFAADVIRGMGDGIHQDGIKRLKASNPEAVNNYISVLDANIKSYTVFSPPQNQVDTLKKMRL